jgi:hypothetical protein
MMFPLQILIKHIFQENVAPMKTIVVSLVVPVMVIHRGTLLSSNRYEE